MKRTKKQTPVEVLYYHYFNRVAVGMMSIPQISKEIQAVIDANMDDAAKDETMKGLVSKYRRDTF